MELPKSRKLFYFFPVLLCFCLPFGANLSSWIIVFWTLVSLLNIEKNALLKGLRQPTLWLCWGFFFATVASALLSSQKDEIGFSIEVKLSFLLFPYLLFCFSWPSAILKRSIIGFVSGCFFAALYLILRAFIYSLNGQPEYFFYTMFSDLIHASYFSMYLLMALVFVVVLYPRWFHSQKSLIYSSYFFGIIFIATIVLCASKLGLICLFICLPLLTIYKLRRRLNVKKIILLVFGLLIIMTTVLALLPGTSERLNNLVNIHPSSIDKTATESTAVRILIWQQSIQLISENFWTGTGVADANIELYKKYKEQGLNGALDHKLNAHNQYFQTAIGMGIVGLMLMLALTFGQLIKGLRENKVLLCFFALITSLNFLVESMLQTSAGVVFFGFFVCFFAIADKKELTDTPDMNVTY